MQRVGAGLARAVRSTQKASLSTAAAEKIEVFVDDKKVLVDPGVTILQVSLFILLKPFFCRHVLL